jgi:hypothetical protein
MDYLLQRMMKKEVPLVFGDSAQIEAIRSYERKEEEKMKSCGACNGEGSIICGHCKGTGEAK